MAGERSVAIVGGGHNGLVAAALLARSGAEVTLFERAEAVGGAAVSTRPFAGVDVSVSPYAYLVSLFPAALMAALGISVELRSRQVAWCAPDGDVALVRRRFDTGATARSFAAAGIVGELDRLEQWEAVAGRIAATLAPTLMEPLRAAEDVRRLMGEEAWALLCGGPLGASLRDAFDSDLLRGVVLTDGLIGTFSRSEDPTLAQNRCFLYHVIGNGTGEWRVPVGGMGSLTGALAAAARAAGADIRTSAEVVRLDADGRRAELETADGGRHAASVVLVGTPPTVLDRILGRPAAGPGVDDGTRAPGAGTGAPGAQVKVNMVVRRLPRLRAGVSPEEAFSGTLHVNERASQLDTAWEAAASGRLPQPVPCEVYCHSLTDDSVLGPGLRGSGVHTLSLFALQTPAALFEGRSSGGTAPVSRVSRVSRVAATAACLASLQSVLDEPLEDVLLRTPDGEPCIEVHTPADLEEELGLPGGNIFHGALRWPWAEEDAEVGRWGVETDIANVLVCGSGARRGGGVSGIGGHNAAMAALALLSRAAR